MTARNLLIPFRRDRKRDLATGAEGALLASKVRQVLLTEGSTPRSSGELPWRTNFGAGLGLARHRPNDAVLAELTRVQVRDALRRWLPAVAVVEVEVAALASTLSVRVRVQEGGTVAAVTTEL
jgi:phage baseplate assembly protein W